MRYLSPFKTPIQRGFKKLVRTSSNQEPPYYMNHQSETHIRKLLQDATVSIRVLNSEGTDFSSIGTGFFVAPNLVITCAHVINNLDSSAIEVYDQRTDKKYLSVIKYIDENQDADVALLSIDNSVEEHCCVYLDNSQPVIHDNLYSYGYPNNDYRNGDSTTFLYEGESYQSNVLVYKLKIGEVDSGASGSPVLNLRTGGVSCMIRSSRELGTDMGARAVPSSIILDRVPNLRIAHNKYHFYNRTWREYLPHDIEATDFDWETLNLYRGLWNYFKVVWVLLKALLVWTLFGKLVNNSFPISEVLSIFWGNRNGYLGDKIKELSSSLKTLSINSRDITHLTSEQLNSLESKYWLIVEVIDVASPKIISKEISRIFYTVERFEEERTKVVKTKVKTGKQFKNWDSVCHTWNSVSSPITSRLSFSYRKTEEILNNLIFEYIEELACLFQEIDDILHNWRQGFPKNIAIFFLCHRYSINILLNVVSGLSDLIDISTFQIQCLLHKAVKNNPTLKLLLKAKILVDFASQRSHLRDNSMSDKPHIRVRQRLNNPRAKNKYHFNTNCDDYPKIEQKGEEVICFESSQEAEEKGYLPCLKCGAAS